MSPPSSEALSRTLCASGFEVRAVVPDGDCFYECVHQQLPLSGRPDNLANVKAMRDLVADKCVIERYTKLICSLVLPFTQPQCTRPCWHEICCAKETQFTDRVKRARPFGARRITQELFDLYRMFAEAGVDEFAWMRGRHAPRDLESLRSFARVCGRECGAGGCLWADQHAIETVAQAADVQILIVDEQARELRAAPRALCHARDSLESCPHFRWDWSKL
eukprot:2540088-Pleurochrysis_carterae.AAC.2